jgi:hypothetical protein
MTKLRNVYREKVWSAINAGIDRVIDSIKLEDLTNEYKR